MRIRRNFHMSPKSVDFIKEQEPPAWVVRLYEGDPRMGWPLTDWEIGATVSADDAKAAFLYAVGDLYQTGYLAKMGFLSTASSHREDDPTDITLFTLRDYFPMYP